MTDEELLQYWMSLPYYAEWTEQDLRDQLAWFRKQWEAPGKHAQESNNKT